MENAEEARVLSPRAKRIIAIVLAVAILAAGGYFTPEEDTLKAVPGYSLAAQNGNMALYVKTDTAEVAVYDKRNGETVYSNPPDASKDTVAKTDIHKHYLKSQFILSYLD